MLTVEQKHQLKELLLQNGDLFALDPSELGVANVVQHAINTGDSTPIRQQASRIPFVLRSKVDNMTEEMLEQVSFNPHPHDDILVLGATLEKYLQNLSEVFDRLRKAGLQLRPTKCHLVWKEITYLGFIVTDKGVAADPQKIEAVRSYPTPTDLKHLRSLLYRVGFLLQEAHS